MGTRACGTETENTSRKFQAYRGPAVSREAFQERYADGLATDMRTRRQTERESIRRRAERVPSAGLHIGAAAIGLTGTLILLDRIGVASAIAANVGGALASAYSIALDLLRSMQRNDPGWRDRHRIISRLVPPHPLD
ncbi:hypothetical protein ABZ490_07075 [Streptomyces sp. NPDC005811]|uniref:hypothetical protein n=1 Tax=Streptomyces sp. NPDC005811 TaxID=3154565 RepID=UPI0033D0E781